MKRSYDEGSVFLVPLRNGGFARGVVARLGPKGDMPFGYFFGPRLETETDATLSGLVPTQAILRLMFGCLGLKGGTWKVIGKVPDWDRSQWGMPDFATGDPRLPIKRQGVRYSDTDPTKVAAVFDVPQDTDMPRDSLSGPGSVEIKLTKLLS